MIADTSTEARSAGVYTVGLLKFGGNAINGNKAPDGAVVYVIGPTDRGQQYCNVYGNISTGSATLNDECVPVEGACTNGPSSYSILSGNTNSRADFRPCHIKGVPTRVRDLFGGNRQ